MFFVITKVKQSIHNQHIKFSRGLKYILEGFISSQNEIVNLLKTAKIEDKRLYKSKYL